MMNETDFKTILKEMDADYYHDFIATSVKEQYLENCINKGFSGWTNRIMLTKEGKLYISGAMSYGSMNMSEYEGEEIRIFSIPCAPEVETELSEYELEELTGEQQKQLYNMVCEMEGLDAEDKEEYDNIFTLLNSCHYRGSVEYCFEKEYPEVWERLTEECAEVDFQYNILDNCYDFIDNAIANL